MEEAYQKMRSENVRHLAISEKEKIVGLLSIKDFANYYNFKFCAVINETDRVSRYAEEEILKIDCEATALHAAEIMCDHNVGSILVEKENDIVGIVTERGFSQRVVADGLDANNVKLSSIMNKPVLLDGHLPMDEALSCMRKNNVRHVVVTEDNKISGVISIKDLTIYCKHKFVYELDFGEPI
jgi:signal-transduction protein with cAMP-binding, CBS, and nucleotidyltransferase domain